MPWGARPTFALRLAAAASLVFWLGLSTFVALGFAFDRGSAAARWWLEPTLGFLVFTTWCAACVATVASLAAIHGEWRRAGVRPVVAVIIPPRVSKPPQVPLVSPSSIFPAEG